MSSTTEPKFFIPEPPASLFVYQEKPREGILKENRQHYIIEKIECKPNILVYYKGAPYPRKGFPTPEAVSSINIVKRIFIETIKTFGMWQFSLSWFLALITTYKGRPENHHDDIIDYGEKSMPVVEKLLASFNRVSYGVVSQYMLKPEHMTQFASEFQGLVCAVMLRLKLDREGSKQFARIIGTLMEYDNAYRYRLEDIFSETTKEKLSTEPYKEVKRLIKLYISREKDMGVAHKFKAMEKLGTLLLLLPKVKLALRKALEHCEFERLQMDEIDTYWCRSRLDYAFGGRSHKERSEGLQPLQGYQLVV